MAISTYKVFLMTSADGETWEKLIDIKEFPDLGGTPERLQTTTLSDKAHTYIAGIQDTEDLTFVCNYDVTDYARVRAFDNGSSEHYWAVWLGGTDATPPAPSGSEGKFKFQGSLSCHPNGGGVNEVVDMTVTLTPATVIEFEGPTQP